MQDPRKQNQFNSYLKYSGLAFQLLATLLLCGWIGYLLDNYLELKFPAFMLGFGFAGFFAFMYQLYKSINK